MFIHHANEMGDVLISVCYSIMCTPYLCSGININGMMRAAQPIPGELVHPLLQQSPMTWLMNDAMVAYTVGGPHCGSTDFDPSCASEWRPSEPDSKCSKSFGEVWRWEQAIGTQRRF